MTFSGSIGQLTHIFYLEDPEIEDLLLDLNTHLPKEYDIVADETDLSSRDPLIRLHLVRNRQEVIFEFDTMYSVRVYERAILFERYVIRICSESDTDKNYLIFPSNLNPKDSNGS